MLKINFEEHENGVIVIMDGELSFSFIKEFEKIFNKYYTSKYGVVALDLKNVPYLDSFGISRIVKVSREFKSRSIDFILINVNDNIHQILRMATFDKILNIMSRDFLVDRYFPGEDSLKNTSTGRRWSFSISNLFLETQLPCNPPFQRMRSIRITGNNFLP